MSTGDPETRRRILDAGRRLLERDQIGSVSIGAVAAEAGVSRQAAYLHFGSRTQLFCEIARHVDATERTADKQRVVDEAVSGKEALALAVQLQADLKPRIRATATALDVLRRGDAAAEAAYQERERARLQRCRNIVQRLQDESELSPAFDVKSAAQWMWAITSLHTWQDLVAEQGWSKQRYVQDITRCLTQTLLRAPAKPARSRERARARAARPSPQRTATRETKTPARRSGM